MEHINQLWLHLVNLACFYVLTWVIMFVRSIDQGCLLFPGYVFGVSRAGSSAATGVPRHEAVRVLPTTSGLRLTRKMWNILFRYRVSQCLTWFSSRISVSCDDRMEQELNWLNRLGPSLQQCSIFFCSVKVKERAETKNWSSRSIYVLTLICGHELWIITTRTKSWIQATEINLFYVMPGFSLWRSFIQEEPEVELLLLCIKINKLKDLEISIFLFLMSQTCNPQLPVLRF